MVNGFFSYTATIERVKIIVAMPSSYIQTKNLSQELEKSERMKDHEDRLNIHNGHYSYTQQLENTPVVFSGLHSEAFGIKDEKDDRVNIHSDIATTKLEKEPVLQNKPVLRNPRTFHPSIGDSKLPDCGDGVEISSSLELENTTNIDVALSEKSQEKYMNLAPVHHPWKEINLDRLSSDSQGKSDNESLENWVDVHVLRNTDQEEDLIASRVRDRSVEDLSGRYAEILVYEGDTDSDAGSEDVELLPHRYNSGAVSNTHLYVNKLSLAAELLRTKESLPYDEEFKLVVDDTHHDSETRQGNLREVNSRKRSLDELSGQLHNVPFGHVNPAFLEDETPIKKQLMVKGSGECIVKVGGEHVDDQEEDENDEEEELYRSPGRKDKGYRRFGIHRRENSPLLPLYASTILNCPCCVVL